ncbi:hypothetical protein OBV_35930 [Oscillibacter valericigenes Sjm18-20]|nr:hypothetical protein OBV_35930 [Oscillibacter valericigenes Sjm18-20]
MIYFNTRNRAFQGGDEKCGEMAWASKKDAGTVFHGFKRLPWTGREKTATIDFRKK